MNRFSEQWAAPVLQGLQQRNQRFDRLFYDVGALSEVEKQQLSPLESWEGSIVVVSPQQSGRPIREYADVASMLAAEASSVKAVAVAGVGSSVIGTAALARNVADAFGFDVVGVVSGYGASDLMLEAMGGWFFYGMMDAYRYQLRKLLDDFDALVSLNPATAAFSGVATQLKQAQKPVDSDISTLSELLESNQLQLSLLVGHSKGSLLIDYALEQFAAEHGGESHPYYENLNVVTLGAVVNFPPQYRRLQQFIGELDWFGGLNSRIGVENEKVASGWHHLNTELPYHIDTTVLLRERVTLV